MEAAMSGIAGGLAPSTAEERLGGRSIFQVIGASSVGTMIEWYDFYIFGSLATVIALQFYPKGNPTAALLSTLATFAAGFAARPFGALFFGSLSDRIGHKPVMMAGNLLGAVLTFPLFALMYHFSPLNNNYNPVAITACAFCLVLLVTMVYGPIAAFLVESFPSRVRYTSVSLPYHIGNGYFGGFLPLIATAVVAAAQLHPEWANVSRYMGLIFPISVALITFIVGSLLLRETRTNSLDMTESNQIGYNPFVFGGLIGLSVIALVLADQLLMPQIDASNTSSLKAQSFFRVLAALIVIISVAFGMVRCGRTVSSPAVSGDD
jgi:MFS family permease